MWETETSFCIGNVSASLPDGGLVAQAATLPHGSKLPLFAIYCGSDDSHSQLSFFSLRPNPVESGRLIQGPWLSFSLLAWEIIHTVDKRLGGLRTAIAGISVDLVTAMNEMFIGALPLFNIQIYRFEARSYAKA